jgi:hypothetical protein
MPSFEFSAWYIQPSFCDDIPWKRQNPAPEPAVGWDIFMLLSESQATSIPRTWSVNRKAVNGHCSSRTDGPRLALCVRHFVVSLLRPFDRLLYAIGSSEKSCTYSSRSLYTKSCERSA